MMAEQTYNEGFRMLDESRSEAIDDPAKLKPRTAEAAQNEGMRVLEECVVDVAATKLQDVPDSLRSKLQSFNQEHVLADWEQLSGDEKQQFIAQLQSLDFSQLQQLYHSKDETYQLPSRERIAPMPRQENNGFSAEDAKKEGDDVFRSGRMAFLVVAGGQGSRLGFPHPKGMFPVGPISEKSLFQIHAEKVVALRRRYNASIPFLVMTSPATDHETREFLEDHDYFGLPSDDVWFFCQGTMPSLDLHTGKLLLEKSGRLFTSPNGHGGTITGLAESGMLQRLRERNINTIYYFQVDNPLVNLADAVFVGRHHHERAEISSKVLVKEKPEDKLGNFVLVDGRCAMIEYSDLPDDMARETDEQGRLVFWAGNPAIHLFDVEFLAKVTGDKNSLPFHVAKKKVPHIGDPKPSDVNALKFEMFIFDILPLAERWSITATDRRTEFEPLKNAEGPDSPETVRRAIIGQARDWLKHAGVNVAREVDVEISPLFALDAVELADKVEPDLVIDEPTYLQ